MKRWLIRRFIDATALIVALVLDAAILLSLDEVWQPTNGPFLVLRFFVRLIVAGTVGWYAAGVSTAIGRRLAP